MCFLLLFFVGKEKMKSVYKKKFQYPNNENDDTVFHCAFQNRKMRHKYKCFVFIHYNCIRVTKADQTFKFPT